MLGHYRVLRCHCVLCHSAIVCFFTTVLVVGRLCNILSNFIASVKWSMGCFDQVFIGDLTCLKGLSGVVWGLSGCF